jgi:hypothetical protein
MSPNLAVAKGTGKAHHKGTEVTEFKKGKILCGLTNEINDQQTLSASEPASGKARERRHSGSISSERNAAGGRL